MPLTCAGCTDEIKRGATWIKCPKCKNCFHQSCVNYVSNKPLPSSRIAEGWTCPDCSAKSKRGGDNSSTPVKLASTPECQLSGKEMSEVEESSKPLLHLQDMTTLKNDIISALTNELPKIIRKQMAIVVSPLEERLKELQNSVAFLSDKYDDFCTKMDKLLQDNQLHDQQLKSNREDIDNLNEKIRILEQQLRDCNIEVHGVNEFKNENLYNIMKHIADTVSLKLDDNDLVKVTRVAKFNKENKKPRTIVAKLVNSRRRDEFLSAVARYNKSNPTNKINTGLVGVPGDRSPIFVAEHLSPSNKALHAATRIKAKEMKYKFVWVRDGHIYIRKDESSRYIHIKNNQSLGKIV